MKDHSVRSPSTDGGGALRRTLSESSNTVRAGMREALEACRTMLADAPIWHAIIDAETMQSLGGVIDAALQLPETGEIPFADSAGLKSRTAQSEQGGCGDDLAPQGATASINSEANLPAAPCSTCDLPDRVNELSPAPVDAGVREAIKPFANLLRLYDGYESEFGKPANVGVEISDIRKLVAALSSQPVVRVDQGSIATKPTTDATSASGTELGGDA